MHVIAEGRLAADVADAGTFTVSYPARPAPEIGVCDEGDFYLAMGHQIVLGQNNALGFPDDVDLTFGTASITVTNKSGSTWLAGTDWTLQLEFQGKAAYTDVGFRGTGNRMARMFRADGFRVNLGAPDALDRDGISVAQQLAGAGNLTITGALASGGSATLDVPRGLTLYSAGNLSAVTFTVTGKDEYGNTMSEASAGPNNSTVYLTKAFKKVTQIAASAAVGSDVEVGTSDLIGLPMFLPSSANVLAVLKDGVPLPKRTRCPWSVTQVDLLAGTSEFVVTPHGGYIDRHDIVVAKAVTTGGPVTVELGGTAVVGLTSTVADAAAAGTVYTDQPTTLTGHDATTKVADRGAIEIVFDASFATAGEIRGVVEINSEGVFQPGIRTAGGSTTTTGDTRGTFKPTVACDGAIVFELIVALPDPGYRGIAQA